MADKEYPGVQPDTPEGKADVERLRKLVDEVEQILKLHMTEDDQYFMIVHTKNNISGYTGNGCAACSILRTIEWGLRSELKHDEGDVFSPFPTPIGIIKLPESIKKQIEELAEKMALALDPTIDPKATKH